MIREHRKGYDELYPSEGKLLIIDGEIVLSAIVKTDTTPPNIIEIDDADYIPPSVEPIEPTISDLQENQIAWSKKNLAKYLEDNPLFSRVKYEDGRYYTVTFQKQQQLSSKLMLYKLYEGENIPYVLTWNDTGNINEEWTYEELLQLSVEINNYVSPLIEEQQKLEVKIKNIEDQEELLRIKTYFNK